MNAGAQEVQDVQKPAELSSMEGSKVSDEDEAEDEDKSEDTATGGGAGSPGGDVQKADGSPGGDVQKADAAGQALADQEAQAEDQAPTSCPSVDEFNREAQTCLMPFAELSGNPNPSLATICR